MGFYVPWKNLVLIFPPETHQNSGATLRACAKLVEGYAEILARLTFQQRHQRLADSPSVKVNPTTQGVLDLEHGSEFQCATAQHECFGSVVPDGVAAFAPLLPG